MPTIDAPSRHRGRGRAREREQRARVRGERPVPVLVLGLERRADDAGRGGVDEDVERAERRDLLGDPRRGDVAAHEHRLGAELAQLGRGLLGGRVSAHVADRDARGAERGEAERDRLADPARPARHEDGRALEGHSAFGSGSYAGADDGMRLPADARAAAPAARPPRATRRGRGGRAAPSSPRRSAGSDGRRADPR